MHGPPVTTASDMSPGDRCWAILYGCHTSARRDTHFVCTELAEKTRYGHIIVLLWSRIQDLPGLWMSPVGLILQSDRRPWIIYDYTFIGINDAVARQAPQEVIQFGMAFKRLLGKILSMEPAYVPVFLSDVDLSNSYMRVWVRPEDLPHLAFVIVLYPSDLEPLICFHLSLPMGFVDLSQLFCCTTETVDDMVNTLLIEGHTPSPNPLDALSDSTPAADEAVGGRLPDPDTDRDLDKLFRNLLAVEAARLRRYDYSYVEDFCFLAQGGPASQAAAQRHIFNKIDRVFRPNDANNCIRKEPNSLKNYGWAMRP